MHAPAGRRARTDDGETRSAARDAPSQPALPGDTTRDGAATPGRWSGSGRDAAPRNAVSGSTPPGTSPRGRPPRGDAPPRSAGHGGRTMARRVRLRTHGPMPADPEAALPSPPAPLRALLLAACAAAPAAAGAQPARAAPAIAIVAAPEPAAYTVTADSGITTLRRLASGGYAADRRPRGALFTARLAAAGFAPGRRLTEAVAEALRGRGYVVRVVPAAPGRPDDPAGAGAPLARNGALLRLLAPQIGFHTPAMSLACLPRLNATAVMSVGGRAAPLYDATLHYGVDARPGRPWAIVADAAFAYADFDAVLADLGGVQAGFSAGLRQVGARMAEQIDAALH